MKQTKISKAYQTTISAEAIRRLGLRPGQRVTQIVDGQRLILEPVEDVDARTRDFLAKFIAVAAGTAVSSTGVYGVAAKDFRPLTTVWAVVGPVIGAVVTYYFGPRRDSAG